MTSGSTVHVLIVKVDLTNGYHFTLLTLLGVYRPSGKLCDVINIEGHMRGTCVLGKVILGSGSVPHIQELRLQLRDYWYCTAFTICACTACILITIRACARAREQPRLVRTYVCGTYRYGNTIL